MILRTEKWKTYYRVLINSPIILYKKINTPHFIRKKGKRSNLLDLLTWYYYKNKTVSWDLFGPELENYCQAIDMQAIPYYGSYRCGFSFSDSQIAHFLRSRESIPEIFNVKLLEAALTADGSLLQIMEPSTSEMSNLL